MFARISKKFATAGFGGLHIVVLARLINLASGVALIFVIANAFTLQQQGIVYTFLSLVAAQYFFDLGIGHVLANIVGRSIASNGTDATLSNDSLKKIAVAIRFVLLWGLVAGGAMVLILGSIGHFTLSQASETEQGVLNVWYAYILLTAFVMTLHIFLRILEGIGLVVQAAIARSFQSAANVIFLLGFSAYGFGLASVAWALGFAIVISATYLLVASPSVKKMLSFVSWSKPIQEVPIDWKKDIWPFQSRMSATWVTSYIIFQAQVPILFALAGPEAAGRFGIMVQIFQALNTSANIFLTYNIRPWTQLAAKGDATALHRTLRRTMALTVVLMAAGTLLVLGGLWGLNAYGFAMAERFPAMWIMGLYALAATANQVFFCLGYYFRARGEEPLWWISVLAAAVILTAPLVLGAGFDIPAAIFSFFGASVVILTVGGSLFARWYINTHPLRVLHSMEPS